MKENMNFDIAKTVLYKYKNGRWINHSIVIYRPIPDELSKYGDYKCGVKIGRNKIKFIYGIDSFQALFLAISYIQGIGRKLLNKNEKLYHEENIESECDINTFILNALSKYIKYKKIKG